MEPTLRVGSMVTVRSGRLAVGEIVTYYAPEGLLLESCGPRPHRIAPGGAACDAPVARHAGIELVKRIVGAPGDTIYIREGHVYRKAEGAGGFQRESDGYTKACGDARICDYPTPIEVPAGHWFLMGDDRGRSDDSRTTGPVPTSWITGIVEP